MKRLYRLVLQKLRSYLVDNLRVDGELIDELLSTLVLDTTEAEIIEHERCNRDKIKRIITSLSPKADQIYISFKECLHKTKNGHVLKQIGETENVSASEVSTHEEETKRLLLNSFQANQQETFTTIQEFEDVLLNDPSSRIGDNFVDDILDSSWLKAVIQSLFPDSKEGSRPSGNRNKKKKKKGKNTYQPKPGFYGISSKSLPKRERQESESSQCSDIDVDVDDIFYAKREQRHDQKNSFTVEEFYHWIQQVLETHCGDSTAAARFKNDDIDGSVFDELTSEELQEYLPKLGQRKKVRMMWQQLKGDLNSAANIKVDQGRNAETVGPKDYQPPRPFECHATYKFKYRKGAFITDIEARTGNPLFPVHKYIDVKAGKLTNVKEATAVASEVVRFGSACMNDRTNGTIHFGIKSTGEITGCVVSAKMVERTITNFVRQSFYDGQVSIALNCIRPAQFVEVIGEDCVTDTMFVIEIDVISSYKFVEDFAFFLKPVAEHEHHCLMYRFDGDIKLLNAREVDKFMKDEKKNLSDSRKEFEDKIRKSDENRNQVLKNFLCCGNEHFEQSIFPLLVLNEMEVTRNEDINFLKYIKWRAIFDFNKNGGSDCAQAYLEEKHDLVFNTNFIEDFDTRKVNESRVHQIVDNLKSSSLPNWIYCNGSIDDHIADPCQWKMDRSGSFRKAIEFYVDNIPSDRGRVLIPLFGKETKLLAEAAEEVFVKFPNKCLVITESETVSCNLRDALHKRNVLPGYHSVDDCFLIGLPWKQVSEAVSRFVPKLISVEGLEIPRSTGVPVVIPVAFRRELCDLEILASNECCGFKQMNEEDKEVQHRTNGENFYRGGIVTWQNLYFSDQVLYRDVHNNLIERVNDIIKCHSNYNQSVRHLMVYHQPGAGGSTTSRQLLWSMREKYKCCVVKVVTKQTTEQINRLRLYGEENNHQTKPVLVLVDLDEEDTVERLRDELASDSQKYSCNVFCVMIICSRVSELPLQRETTSVLIQQHLTDREQNWFKEKYKHLDEKHKHDKGCDPNTLLSLNIMKENYNMDTIGKSVAKFVRDPLLRQLRDLLKYLAYLNHYDINFQPVPVNSFDPIMATLDWTSHIPQSFNILVNKVNQHGVSGNIPCIRIANYLLSKPVLHAVLELTKEERECNCTVGEIATELLSSNMIKPHVIAQHNKMFEKILADIIKKREFFQSNEKPKRFSLLVMELLDTQDYDTAIDIVDKTYTITDDPMVAQQLARLHAEIGNWEDAHRSIGQAMKQIHDHSYLTHTCGQVYRMEFDSICKENGNNFDDDTTVKIVQIAQDCHFYFKQAQRISRYENITPQNPAGFDGEIRLAIEILKALHLPDVIEICKKKKHSMPDTKNGIKKGCICRFMEGLHDSTVSAIQVLETDIYTMRKNSFPLQNYNFLTLLENGKLRLYKKEFKTAFYRSTQRTHIKTPSIESFVDATHATDDTLMEIVKTIESCSDELNKQQIRIYLASSLELFLRNSKSFPVKTEKLLNSSKIFFYMLPDSNPTCRLEAHLMIVSLHWPLETKSSLRDMLCPHSSFIKALNSWQHIVDDKPSKPKYVDRIIYFIANYKQFPCLIKPENINKNNIAIFQGKVCSNGLEIEIIPYGYRTGNIPPIRMPALHQVKMSSLWNKQTGVVIGFGLHGPKADLLENIQLSSNTNNSPRNNNATIVQDNIPSLPTGSVSTKPKIKHKKDSSRRPQFQNTAPLQRYPHSPTGMGHRLPQCPPFIYDVRNMYPPLPQPRQRLSHIFLYQNFPRPQ